MDAGECRRRSAFNTRRTQTQIWQKLWLTQQRARPDKIIETTKHSHKAVAAKFVAQNSSCYRLQAFFPIPRRWVLARGTQAAVKGGQPLGAKATGSAQNAAAVGEGWMAGGATAI